jgi:hypothetical protein
VNENQGAESTLAFLMALLEMRLLEDAEIATIKHETLAEVANVESPHIPLEIQ